VKELKKRKKIIVPLVCPHFLIMYTILIILLQHLKSVNTEPEKIQRRHRLLQAWVSF